jgi:MFS family permease
VCFLDRVNIGFAALQMNHDLGLSPAEYGFGAGIFFLGYVPFEVPSNLMLARFGARRWIARIMITWGLLASAMMLVPPGPRAYHRANRRSELNNSTPRRRRARREDTMVGSFAYCRATNRIGCSASCRTGRSPSRAGWNTAAATVSRAGCTKPS